MRLTVVEPRPSKSLFSGLCQQCPRQPWCAQTPEKMCAIGPNEDLHFELEMRRINLLGGVDPRALPKMIRQPMVPRIVHVHSDRCPSDTSWKNHIGISARHVLRPAEGAPLNQAYLRENKLTGARKVLQITGKDPFLIKFLNTYDDRFFNSLNRTDITAVIGPNLSAYRHVDHRNWLDARAVCQNFMDELLSHGLPGILHTYLEDHPLHERWLIEYFKKNPTQKFIATGFDRGSGKSLKFVKRRVDMLLNVEQAIGEPLQVILASVFRNLNAIRIASTAFPGRIHILTHSAFNAATGGQVLKWKRKSKRMDWVNDDRLRRGQEILYISKRRYERLLKQRVPEFWHTG